MGVINYTAFGQETFLEEGYEILVAAYNENRYNKMQIRQILNGNLSVNNEYFSYLPQTVI